MHVDDWFKFKHHTLETYDQQNFVLNIMFQFYVILFETMLIK